MIKSLSPYYISTPFISPLTSETCSEYKMQLFIWDGLKASVPAEPEYEITKTNLASSIGNDKIDIARMINDFVDFRPVGMTSTGVYDGENQRWIKTQIIYTTTDAADDDTIQLEATSLMTKGYSYGMDGENASTPTNNILLSGSEFKVYKSGFFTLPVLISESTTSPVTVKSYPANTIDYSNTIAASTTSAEMIKNIFVNVAEATSEDYIEIVYNSQTITLLITDECRYTPVDIAFQNKEGALQFLTFFKARTDTISTTSEEYESNTGQPNLWNHQHVKYNVQGRSKFKINSGFVSEDLNETFKQLLLSEKAYHLSGGVYIPLNLETTSLEYKSRQKDRLINYEIEMSYAFNEINNI